MRSEDKKIKATAKDTHGLRLNLKSPENRQRYPPDDSSDLDAIQVISSEYELVLPQLDTKNTSTPISTVPNVPPPPPFPPDGFLQKLPVVTDELLCLPKIKNKYGAVSKTYMKKLSSIFNNSNNNNNNSNHNNNNQNLNSAKVINNDEKVPDDENDEDDEDEGRGSLSEKSDKNINSNGNCDKKIDDKNYHHHPQHHVKKCASDKVNNDVTTATTMLAPSNNAKNSKPPNNLDLGETIGTFTLPRIALNKTG